MQPAWLTGIWERAQSLAPSSWRYQKLRPTEYAGSHGDGPARPHGEAGQDAAEAGSSSGSSSDRQTHHAAESAAMATGGQPPARTPAFCYPLLVAAVRVAFKSQGQRETGSATMRVGRMCA